MTLEGAPTPDFGKTATEQPLLLTAEETAEFLGISVRHVYKLHSSGRIPLPVRLGRSVRWRREELIAWIDAGAPPRDRWLGLRVSLIKGKR